MNSMLNSIAIIDNDINSLNNTVNIVQLCVNQYLQVDPIIYKYADGAAFLKHFYANGQPSYFMVCYLKFL